MIDTKPPLNAVYLAHFGVRGMKWGQRRKSTGKGRRKAPSVRRTVLKGAAIGVALTAGAYAVGRMLPSRVGRTKLTDIGFQNPGTIRVKSTRLYPKALTVGKKRVDQFLYSDETPMTNLRNAGFAFRNGQFVKV